MKKVSVDSILENYAICEDEFGNILSISLENLPKGLKEGDILKFDKKDVIIDEESTKKQRAKIIELQNQVFK